MKPRSNEDYSSHVAGGNIPAIEAKLNNDEQELAYFGKRQQLKVSDANLKSPKRQN